MGAAEQMARQIVPFRTGPTARNTLREVFDQAMRPVMEDLGLASSTVDAYQTALRKWDATGKGDLPVADINRQDFQELYADLQRRGNCNRTTVRNNAKRLLGILQFCGPARNGQGDLAAESIGILDSVVVLPAVPRFDRKRSGPTAARKVLTDDQVRALFRACECMDWPRGRADNHACRTWRAFLVAGLAFGINTTACRFLEGGGFNPDRRGAGVFLDRACPSPDAPGLRHRWGWIVCRRQKTGRLCVVPMPELAHELLAPFARRRRRQLFAWGTGKGSFQRELQALRDIAGVDFNPKDMRSTCNQWWHRAHRDAPPFVLAHKAPSVALGHYTSGPHLLLDCLPDFQRELHRVLRRTIK